MVFSASGKLMKAPEVVEQIGKFGYSEDLILVIGILEVCCVIIFLIPRTVILGAVLLTGYLGGAIATHVRMHDIFFLGATIIAILVWLAVYLRDPRVRTLLPFRRPLAPAEFDG
jgi:hypothetical protein